MRPNRWVRPDLTPTKHELATNLKCTPGNLGSGKVRKVIGFGGYGSNVEFNVARRSVNVQASRKEYSMSILILLTLISGTCPQAIQPRDTHPIVLCIQVQCGSINPSAFIRV